MKVMFWVTFKDKNTILRLKGLQTDNAFSHVRIFGLIVTINRIFETFYVTLDLDLSLLQSCIGKSSLNVSEVTEDLAAFLVCIDHVLCLSYEQLA